MRIGEVAYDTRLTELDAQEIETTAITVMIQHWGGHSTDDKYDDPYFCLHCDDEYEIRFYDEEAWTLHQMFMEDQAEFDNLESVWVVDLW